jgi:hypothetical protein
MTQMKGHIKSTVVKFSISLFNVAKTAFKLITVYVKRSVVSEYGMLGPKNRNK